MKVLIVVYADYPGTIAASNHVQRYALGLQLAGDDVTVVGYLLKDDVALSGRDSRGVRYESFRLPRGPKWLGSYLSRIKAFTRGMTSRLEELLSRETFDACIYEGRSWIVGRALWKIARRHGMAIFPYPVEWHGPTMSRVLGGAQLDTALFRRRLLPRSDGVIGISRFWQRMCEARNVPFVLIPGLADLLPDAQPPATRTAARPFPVVFVGTWIGREMPQTIFQGLQLAIERGVDLQFVVVGRVGQKREEQAAVAALEARPQLKQRTVRVGWVSDEQLAEHLRTAGAFVLLRPQDRETDALFPTRLPEYLISGNPVILSDAGDLALYVRHRESAWVIPAGNAPSELADAVAALASDEALRQRIGLNGWQAALEYLSLGPLGRKLHDFLESVVKDRAGSRT